MHPDRGFSLVEALVATLVFCVAFSQLATLFPLATRSTRQARTQAYATLLAAQALERLRDAADTGTLVASAPDAWSRSVDGFVDYVGDDGATLAGGPGGALDPPATAVYVRRWAATPLPTDPANGWVLRAFVAPLRRADDGTARPATGADGSGTGGAGAALVHVRLAP